MVNLVAKNEQTRRIQEHFRALMRRADVERGVARRIAEATGVSEAHISKMLSEPPTANPGRTFMQEFATKWLKTSYEEEVNKALGEWPCKMRAARCVSLWSRSTRPRRQCLRSSIQKDSNLGLWWWAD